jgi:hypothetical protein
VKLNEGHFHPSFIDQSEMISSPFNAFFDEPLAGEDVGVALSSFNSFINCSLMPLESHVNAGSLVGVVMGGAWRGITGRVRMSVELVLLNLATLLSSSTG